MFENIGGKIKLLAKIICWIGMAFSAFAAISIWVDGENIRYFYDSYSISKTGSIIGGLLVLGLGSLLSWIGTWFIYAFGDLVEHVAAIWYMMMEMRREDRQ